jgi:alpha-beta hydrolase superfamily lysophospholipase
MQVEAGHATAFDGSRRFTRRWDPPGPVKASVLLVHGIGEHSGRYERVGRHLASAGYAVQAPDLRGHGRSDGKRGHARFADVFRDLDELLAGDPHGGGPAFLYGHSLGGLLVLAYALARAPAVAGVVASAAALHTALREQRLKMLAARAVGPLLPALTVPSGLDDTRLTRDPAELADYRADPLVHRRASLGLGLDVDRAIDRVLATITELPAPVLLVHGGADRINHVTGSEQIARALGARCTLRVYEDVPHKPHCDPESARILDDVVSWLDERC